MPSAGAIVEDEAHLGTFFIAVCVIFRVRIHRISRLISGSVSRECEMRSTEMESERSAGANLTVSDEDAIVTLVLSFRPGIRNSSSTCQAPRQAGALCAKRGGCTLMKLCHNCIQHASCGLAHCLWICRVRRDLSNKRN